ncbi:MAG: hypothetical protein ABSA10_08015 [Anaerolineales bacterium]
MSVRATGGSEAISQPIDKEIDSDKGKGNQGNEKPDCFVGFDEKPKTSKPPRNDMIFRPPQPRIG